MITYNRYEILIRGDEGVPEGLLARNLQQWDGYTLKNLAQRKLVEETKRKATQVPPHLWLIHPVKTEVTFIIQPLHEVTGIAAWELGASDEEHLVHLESANAAKKGCKHVGSDAARKDGCCVPVVMGK